MPQYHLQPKETHNFETSPSDNSRTKLPSPKKRLLYELRDVMALLAMTIKDRVDGEGILL